MKTDMDEFLNKIFEKAVQNGVKRKDLKRFSQIKATTVVKYDQRPFSIKYTFLIISLVVGLFAAGLPKEAYNEPVEYLKDLFAARVFDYNGKCFFHRSYLTFDVLRPVLKCGMCRNITEVGYRHLLYCFCI